MNSVLTARKMKEYDRIAISNGTPSRLLMERAGKAVSDAICELYSPCKVLVVCGSGNNGGDGMIVARLLQDEGFLCDVWYVGEGHTMSEETEELYEELCDSEINLVEYPSVNDYQLVVDAMLGTGISFPVQGIVRDAIMMINRSDASVVSVDIPSGISSDTGEILGAAVEADVTVAIQAYKFGHCLLGGINACGRVISVDIGIPVNLTSPMVIDKKDLVKIPTRNRNANKGDFGRVLVVAGSVGMCGAAYLSAMAAYRSGAGIVEIYAPEANRQILQTLIPEAIVTSYDPLYHDNYVLKNAMERASVIVIGPGIGKEDTAVSIVKDVFEGSMAPIIADADALNIKASENIPFPKDVPVIITPHPGELSRLCKKSVKELAGDVIGTAVDYASENEVICVSKFARTVITNGTDIYINMSGGPSMSKGGSGDVLTGIIAGMLCCDLSPIDAAALAVFIHGSAGDITADRLGEYSPMARDIIDAIPEVLKMRGKV